MSTKRLYRDDQYLSCVSSIVTSVSEKDGCDVITCSESVFYPEGGGQPSDVGTAAVGNKVFDVTHAYDEGIDSEVWHITDAPAGTFKVGDEVSLTIDFDFRFRNMQRHLGEHMLSGTAYLLFDGINCGFHMGNDYITIDIDTGGRMLTDEDLDLAERSVNEAIWSDLPVTVTWYDSYEASLAAPVRKQVPHEGRVSVVTVGDPDEPYDCVACCGTHPSRSSEVGLLTIYKCEPNKGMNRIYFDCGIAAWEKLTRDSRMLAEIAKKHSCSAEDLAGRLELEAESTGALKASAAAMCSYIKEVESKKILDEIERVRGEDRAVYTYSSEVLPQDESMKLGFLVINESSDTLLLVKHPSTHTCFLFSSIDALKCGEIVKEKAPSHNGKGGGRPDNARAVFENERDLKAFVNDVTKAL